MPELNLRTVRPDDFDAVCVVEAQATPNWRYLPAVFPMFLNDQRGEFFLAEYDEIVVGCAKFTVLPDNTAWLETLRVMPAYQGRGIGKQLYERFFALAQANDINTMRMYTGLENAVSRGLAEYFGFKLEQTFHGFSLPCPQSPSTPTLSDFTPVTNPKRTMALLMPNGDAWRDFVVMNRTFYKLTPELCVYLTQQGQVYADSSDNVVVLGARFSPEQALHLTMFVGDDQAILTFAIQHAQTAGTQRLDCLLPDSAIAEQDVLHNYAFQPHPSPYIVMKV